MLRRSTSPHLVSVLAATLVLTLAACVPAGPKVQPEEVQGQRGLVRTSTEDDRLKEAVREEMSQTFGLLSEEERFEYCNHFAEENGRYAAAWEEAAIESGSTEFATYGGYAEYYLLDRCYGEGYVGSSASVDPLKAGQSSPAERTEIACNIKGNISFSTGERIYHVPGQAYYDDTVIDEDAGERWFCTEAEALDAGWRKSKM